MSFQKEKREIIKRYLLEKIRVDDDHFIEKTAENFSISITTVKRYLKECSNQQILLEDTAKKTGYTLKTAIQKFSYKTSVFLNEDKIYFEDIHPLLQNISREASTIWGYTFMEMMNNAIEHSLSENICCYVVRDYLYTEISIADDGIGIFKNVQNYLKQHLNGDVTYQDVLTELYKGKLTSNPQNHSGEGIFFSSKMLNQFAIWSDNTFFTQNCYNKAFFVQSHLISYYNQLKTLGTLVIMKLENQTPRKIQEVFNMYAPIDEGFIKTSIPLKEVCPYGEPIARSQARRILYRLEEFKQVEFDFSDIEFMGQGFADEIFRVFQNEHPDIELIPLHASPSILGMIKHVQKR